MNTINNNLARGNTSFQSQKPRTKLLYANPNLANIKDSINLTLQKKGQINNLKDLLNFKTIVDKIKKNPQNTALIALVGMSVLTAFLSEVNEQNAEENNKKPTLKNKEARRIKFHNRMKNDITNYATAIEKAADEKELNSLTKSIENSFMCNYQALNDGEIKQLDALLNRINTKKKNIALGNILSGLQNHAQKHTLNNSSSVDNTQQNSLNINQIKTDIQEQKAPTATITDSVSQNLVIKPPVKNQKPKIIQPDTENVVVSSQEKTQKQESKTQHSGELVIRPAVKQNKQNRQNNVKPNTTWKKVKNFFQNHIKEYGLGAILLLSALLSINRRNNQSQNNNANQDKSNITIVHNDTTNVKKDTVSVNKDTVAIQPSITPVTKENSTNYIVKKGDNVWNITKSQLKKDNGKNAKNSVINIETRKNVKDNNLHYEKDNYTVIIQPGDTLKVRTYNQK